MADGKRMRLTGKGVTILVFLVLLVGIAAVVELKTGKFLHDENIEDLLTHMTYAALVGLGLTFVIVAGFADMSFHFVSCLATMTMSFMIARGLHPLASVSAGLAAGAAAGIANGIMVGRFKLPAMVATIALGSIAQGLAYLYSRGSHISENFAESGIMLLNDGKVLHTTVPIVIMIAVYMLGYLLLHRSRYGRGFYATGSNIVVARFSGVRVRRYVVAAFVICGVLAALTNMIKSAANGKGDIKSGLALLMPAYAAVFVGVSMFKKPSVIGTFFGALLIGTVRNGFTLLLWPDVKLFKLELAIGVVLIVAIIVSKSDFASLARRCRGGKISLRRWWAWCVGRLKRTGARIRRVALAFGGALHYRSTLTAARAVGRALDCRKHAAALGAAGRDFTPRKAFQARYILLWVLVAMVGVFAIASPTFRGAGNLLEIVRSAGITAVMVLGLTWIVACGEIDVSFPPVAGMASVIVGLCIKKAGMGWPEAMLIAIPIGTLCGLVSGSLVVFFKSPSLIATIAVGTVIGAVAPTVCDGRPVKYVLLPTAVRFLITGRILGVPVLILLVAAVYGAFRYLQDHTAMGQHLYALGENRQAALEAGISERKILLTFFALSGTLAACGGVLYTATFANGQPRMSGSYFIDGLTAVFLGAMIVKAGKPNVIGTFVGAVFLQVLGNGFTLLDVPDQVDDMLKGVTKGALMILGISMIVYSRHRLARRRAA